MGRGRYQAMLVAVAICFALAAVSDRHTSASAELPTIGINGQRIVDANGHTVLLRGFVTITNETSNGEAVRYSLNDYKRMRALGANFQAIRINEGSLEGDARSRSVAHYLDQLGNMVTLAKRVGIYTNFKMTFYNTQGFTGTRSSATWQALWQQSSRQNALIAAWKNVWTRFKNEPTVVGYDLINEPKRGSLFVSDDQFVGQYLTPLYQKIIDALRSIDRQHLVLFQPFLRGTTPLYAPYTARINRPNVVYAPHFYPNLRDYLGGNLSATDQYTPTMRQYAHDAAFNNAPLLIGEYGMPWNPADDGNTQRQQTFEQLERNTYSLLDSYRLSYSRPWYADDRAAAQLPTMLVDWSIIPGTLGLARSPRSFIVDGFLHPYSQQIVGTLQTLSFDWVHNIGRIVLMPRVSKGMVTVAGVIAIPRTYRYSKGFVVAFSNGFTTSYDVKQRSKMRVVANRPRYPGSVVVWDESTSTLSFAAKVKGTKAQSITIEIRRP